MRLLICLALALAPCEAWDTAPHRQITKAAFDALPDRVAGRFGTETLPLIEVYCLYPDRYLEMDLFGFARKGSGPRQASEIRGYCVRPDGQPIHAISGDRESDLSTLVHLFERILSGLSSHRPDEAAKFTGVLSHFIADSLSPPHAVDSPWLQSLAAGSACPGGANIHALIERSLPEISLDRHEPAPAGLHLFSAAQSALDGCYAGAGRNRADLPAIVKAACARDEATLNRYRLRAGSQAATILADALAAIDALAGDIR